MSGGIGVSAPTDPVKAFLDDITNLRQRIADLERAAQRNNGSPWTAWNSKVKWNNVTTNVTSSGQWQYNGDYINMQVGCSLSGAPANGALTIDLPASVIQPFGALDAFSVFGQAFALSRGVAHGPAGFILTDGGSPVTAFVTPATGSLNAWNLTNPWTWKNTDAISFNIRYRWR